jgi:hypothetical protein
MQDLDLVAARSVSKKHANATGFQPKSSWLGRRRSKPTVSVGCASPGPSITGMLPSVQSQPNERATDAAVLSYLSSRKPTK